MTTPRKTRKSVGVSLGITALMAMSLTGCGSSSDADYQGICVDPHSNVRVDDDQCDDNQRDYDGTGNGFFWYYMATSGHNHAPAVGSHYNPSRGTYNSSGLKSSSGGKASVSKGGVPSKGGTVTRGGFGSGFGKASS